MPFLKFIPPFTLTAAIVSVFDSVCNKKSNIARDYNGHAPGMLALSDSCLVAMATEFLQDTHTCGIFICVYE